MVHTFTECGYNIAVDCASGSVHVVDEVALELIDNYEKAGDDGYLKEVAAKHSVSLEEIKECVDDLKELERQGKLFSEDKFLSLIHISEPTRP